jgi:hypothetical protein
MTRHTEDREQIFSDIIRFLQAVRVSSLNSVFLLVDQALQCQRALLMYVENDGLTRPIFSVTVRLSRIFLVLFEG